MRSYCFNIIITIIALMVYSSMNSVIMNPKTVFGYCLIITLLTSIKDGKRKNKPQEDLEKQKKSALGKKRLDRSKNLSYQDTTQNLPSSSSSSKAKGKGGRVRERAKVLQISPSESNIDM